MNKIFDTHRRSIRLPKYDYSEYGYYFVTICAYNREPIFGEIVDGEIKLNETGKIVLAEWGNLPKRYPDIKLDCFVIMPNHIHVIIKIDTVGAVHEPPIRNEPPINLEKPPTDGWAIRELPLRDRQIFMQKRRKMLLPKIIGYFKMNTGKKINLFLNTPGVSIWQRNYYEHIIREENELNNIRQYILENPRSWDRDRNNPKNFKTKKTV